ncbi:hypothetical protein EYF80_024501 [Liparis tanakae]|uniref:Uncharacterized protein n=1 Tax=Liparis tanakae TaxID=230148 RepID=A0A4Z2HHV8_9TELE|nr:hypothetical protein EYF80_024501 [Liparis tanakae]
MSMYLPKRLELSLRLVLAFPKASRTQLDLSSMFFTLREGGGDMTGGVGDGEQVGRPLVQLAALILLHHVAPVDVHGAVRVDGHDHLPDEIRANASKEEAETLKASLEAAGGPVV